MTAVLSRHRTFLIDFVWMASTLALHPDQETFDKEIENYFNRKSFNLAYLKHLITREQSQTEELWSQQEKDQNQLVAAWDISRDLQDININKDDFSIFKHIDNNRLDPRLLIEIFQEVVSHNAPLTYTTFKEQMVPLDDDTYDWQDMYRAMEEDGLSSERQFYVSCCLEAICHLRYNTLTHTQLS